MSSIKKLVIPVAGLGTRFLPATKAQPKEMMPVIDKPIIQYVVEDAVRSGITDIIMVTGPSKRVVEDHFSPNYELINLLKKQGKDEISEEVKKISDENRFQLDWSGLDSLTITNEQSGFRIHPEAKTTAWHNHSQTFHYQAAVSEVWKIFKRQKTFRSLGVAILLTLLTTIKRISGEKSHDVHVTYGNGEEITTKEMKSISQRNKIVHHEYELNPHQQYSIFIQLFEFIHYFHKKHFHIELHDFIDKKLLNIHNNIFNISQKIKKTHF